MPDRMMDQPTRVAIEEAIRFLQPGAVYQCEVDGHGVSIVRLATPASAPEYMVACHTCRALVVDYVEPRRVYVRIYQHTEIPSE